MTTRPVGATYRLQLTPDFGFAAAEALVPYLADLGVTHLYLSPILTPVLGSTHGYDVTDPTTVSAELGGRAGLESLAGAAHTAGLGLVVDIVPNHMGVGAPRENAWWWDVLRYGPSSAWASFFDIDWSPDNGCGGLLAVPVLGSDGAVTVDRSGPEPELAYYEHRFPLAPTTWSLPDAEIAAAQQYRLVRWDSPVRTYRRFFAVDSLAALRQEDPAVFAATHAEIGSWFSDGLVDGLRVDHPDGLTDPGGYLRRLRELCGGDAWIVVEKILEPGEHLDPTLPVAGTTGYDALRELGHAFVDPAGEEPLTRLHLRTTGSTGDAAWLGEQVQEVKCSVARDLFPAELGRLSRAALAEAAATGVSADGVADAATQWVSRVPYYRDDYPVLREQASAIEYLAGRAVPGPAFTTLAAARRRAGEANARFAQLCGAVTAKSVEDTVFYRTARLTSLQEVGGEPGTFGPSDPHEAFVARARDLPAAMTTLSTHDTKRGEDVRARISVLSQCPGEWAAALDSWHEALSDTPPPEPVTGLLLWQAVIGVWPVDGVVTDELRGRVHAYAEKAMREGSLGTSWNAPDEAFEAAAHDFLDGVFDRLTPSVTAFVAALDPHARSDSLGQKLMQLAGPGVPDVYQGTELWEDSLVDPDNRRPVDFRSPREGHPKFELVRSALRLRRERPASFVGGDYVPVRAHGAGSGHVLGFGRAPAGSAPDVVALATRWSLHLAVDGGWRDTIVELPDGTWTDTLSGRTYTGAAAASEIFFERPIALLTC
ncbi:malto-oligosyltrehalose synthase [Tsukamurella sp. 8F]|uniref:malto-oligosyltrehalose synthase n=1 Tax=unclassified Tsukamurella TaxID=2633480 RepID=UPI0023B99D0E|nr:MULTISPECIES: malto-oligosyltrehalose synthase [unclassified Tsukamurella]MDF0529188.1 malto-oligosyltrehalose synthase [Tsukamurella sp. 8J]MDF0585373.1 malto-oligosyltrehalose synthase [Tsukamurella sp. 8F]